MFGFLYGTGSSRGADGGAGQAVWREAHFLLGASLLGLSSEPIEHSSEIA
jgi:hypothetical protein